MDISWIPELIWPPMKETWTKISFIMVFINPALTGGLCGLSHLPYCSLYLLINSFRFHWGKYWESIHHVKKPWHYKVLSYLKKTWHLLNWWVLCVTTSSDQETRWEIQLSHCSVWKQVPSSTPGPKEFETSIKAEFIIYSPRDGRFCKALSPNNDSV